jgi:hypothetical protein
MIPTYIEQHRHNERFQPTQSLHVTHTHLARVNLVFTENNSALKAVIKVTNYRAGRHEVVLEGLACIRLSALPGITPATDITAHGF